MKTIKKVRKYFVRKLHKEIGIAIIAIIAIFLIANLIKPDGQMSARENRMLQQRPSISMENIENGSFMEDYESYVSDQFIFRDFWVSVKARIDLLMGKNYSNGVYKGKDGYLIEEAKAPVENSMAANVQAINTLADSGNVNVYMMLVPDAVEIMDEKLPAFAPVRDQAADIADFTSRLSGNVTQIDVSQTLRDHRLDEQMYYRTDHHWTTLAAYYAFLEAAKTLGIDSSTVSYDRYTVSTDFVGTMASTSGYGASRKDAVEIFVPNNTDVEYVVEYVEEREKKPTVYDSEMLEGNDKYTVFFGGNHPIIDINTTNQQGRRLLVVKDSYANCFIPFLIPYYREIVIVDPRYYYDNVNQEIADSNIDDVLFLYNANTFFEDNSLSSVFEPVTSADGSGNSDTSNTDSGETGVSDTSGETAQSE